MGNGNGNSGGSGGGSGGGQYDSHPARNTYADLSGARYQPYPAPSYGGHGHVGGYGLAGR